MKKLPFILLFALVLVYLCACGAAGPAVQAAITAAPTYAEPLSACAQHSAAILALPAMLAF